MSEMASYLLHSSFDVDANTCKLQQRAGNLASKSVSNTMCLTTEQQTLNKTH